MKLLVYVCGRCGLHYQEDSPRISSWFALCPRCKDFNEPTVHEVPGEGEGER